MEYEESNVLKEPIASHSFWDVACWISTLANVRDCWPSHAATVNCSNFQNLRSLARLQAVWLATAAFPVDLRWCCFLGSLLGLALSIKDPNFGRCLGWPFPHFKLTTLLLCPFPNRIPNHHLVGEVCELCLQINKSGMTCEVWISLWAFNNWVTVLQMQCLEILRVICSTAFWIYAQETLKSRSKAHHKSAKVVATFISGSLAWPQWETTSTEKGKSFAIFGTSCQSKHPDQTSASGQQLKGSYVLAPSVHTPSASIKLS